MSFITQGKTNWKFITIVVFLAVIVAGGILAWQYFGLEKKEIKAPEEKITDETANWKTYKNEEYGFEIKYPPELTFSSKGPNVAQQSLDNGEQISGTVQPSYDTLIFSDQQNKEQFKIEIFHPYEKAISIDNYKDGYLYLYGPCDLRWGFVPTTTQMINKNSIDILKVKGSNAESLKVLQEDEPLAFQNCYYFKNYNKNLIVLSSSDDSILQNIVLTIKLSKLGETANWQTYRNEEYGFEIKYPSFLENGKPGCRINETEDTIFIGPISLMFFDAQGLTLDAWIDKRISETEKDTKEMQETLKQAGNENWQDFGSKLLCREEIFIAGEKAIKLSYQFIGAGFDLPVTISVKKGGQIYDFRTNDANLVDEECAAKFGKKPSEAMELMLSTFRFLE